MDPGALPEVKLLQLNVWGGRLENQVAGLLKKERADIVCLQEVISTKGDAALAVSLEQLQTQAFYDHSFCSPVFSFQMMRKLAHFGNAILSHHPFVSENTIFTNLEYKEDFDFDSDDYNVRNLQHVVIEKGGKRLNVLNHHGHHLHQHKNGDAHTLRQMKLIGDYIDTLQGPIVLTGDFNLAPHSESLEVINKRLDNLAIRHKLRTTRTFLTPKTEVCDYIFVSHDIIVNEFRASNEIASDHKALILDFQL